MAAKESKAIKVPTNYLWTFISFAFGAFLLQIICLAFEEANRGLHPPGHQERLQE